MRKRRKFEKESSDTDDLEYSMLSYCLLDAIRVGIKMSVDDFLHERFNGYDRRILELDKRLSRLSAQVSSRDDKGSSGHNINARATSPSRTK